MQASSAEVGKEAKGCDSDAKNEMEGAQLGTILKVPDQIINEDKEALKKAQTTDENLENIRCRV